MKTERRSRGSSLLELLIAVPLLLIGLFGVTGLLTSSLFGDSESRTTSAAATAAEAALEQLRSTGFTALANGSDSTTIDSIAYTRTWTVSEVVAGSLKRVVVTVAWGSPSKQINLSMYMAKP